MTRTQKGPNGEQQRVTFERDFKNETELNKFLKDFELNLNKNHHYSGATSSGGGGGGSGSGSGHYRPSSANSTPRGGASSNTNDSHMRTTSLDEELIKSPGVVVVEEPGEEPKLYRQDTGELVSDGTFIDPFLNVENNEHPNELPPKHRTRTPTDKPTSSCTQKSTTPTSAGGAPSTSTSSQPQQPTAKLYKDIDDLIEKLRLEQQQQQQQQQAKKSTETTTAKPTLPNGNL